MKTIFPPLLQTTTALGRSAASQGLRFAGEDEDEPAQDAALDQFFSSALGGLSNLPDLPEPFNGWDFLFSRRKTAVKRTPKAKQPQPAGGDPFDKDVIGVIPRSKYFTRRQMDAALKAYGDQLNPNYRNILLRRWALSGDNIVRTPLEVATELDTTENTVSVYQAWASATLYDCVYGQGSAERLRTGTAKAVIEQHGGNFGGFLEALPVLETPTVPLVTTTPEPVVPPGTLGRFPLQLISLSPEGNPFAGTPAPPESDDTQSNPSAV
jgi:hypothetical protein